MYASSPKGETLKRDLHQDDIDAVMHLYADCVSRSEAKAGSTLHKPHGQPGGLCSSPAHGFNDGGGI